MAKGSGLAPSEKSTAPTVKGLLTERSGMYTPKGVDSSSGVNCTKVGMSSNFDWVVPATHDERRYAVSDTNNRYAKGVAPEEERERYFGALAHELREGGAAAMLSIYWR